MAIMEYDYSSNPHPAGFIGLRVFVKKIKGDHFQEYISTCGATPEQVAKARRKAQRLDKRETKDQQLQHQAMLTNATSRSPLSCVYGVSIGVRSRPMTNGGMTHEIFISATGARGNKHKRDKSGAVIKLSKTYSRYDYEWFKQAWELVCRTRAEVIGLKQVPQQWLDGIATPRRVALFVNKKIREAEAR